MKSKLIKFILFIPLLLGIVPLSSCNKDDNKITIAEVTHSLFYAPMYVAKEKGYFSEFGLDIEIVTTPDVVRNVSRKPKKSNKKPEKFSLVLINQEHLFYILN